MKATNIALIHIICSIFIQKMEISSASVHQRFSGFFSHVPFILGLFLLFFFFFFVLHLFTIDGDNTDSQIDQLPVLSW